MSEYLPLLEQLWMRLGSVAARPEAAVGLLGVLLLAAAVACGRWLARREDKGQAQVEAAAAQLAEIKGRLAAMAEMGQQREAELTRSLGERLDGLSRHLAQSLEASAARLSANVDASGTRTTENLSQLNERLAVIAEARQSLAALSSEVMSLHGVLADKQARGAFGQARMEAIVADALPPGSYEFQATLSNGRRPDCLIRLPNAPAALVIDAKFPLEAFEALRTARTPDDSKAAAGKVREAVGRHIADIAERYLISGETQDTALMFVPSESVYATLHDEFPDLIQRAYRTRVVIVAPNVLMLAVQTVQAVIKDVRMRDHADVIQREVGLLLADVARLAERSAELERHFALAGKALEKVTASAGKVRSRGERLTALDLEETPGQAGAAAPSNVLRQVAS